MSLSRQARCMLACAHHSSIRSNSIRNNDPRQTGRAHPPAPGWIPGLPSAHPFVCSSALRLCRTARFHPHSSTAVPCARTTRLHTTLLPASLST
eukprot:2321376-Rhodomonas_salina.1